MKKVSNKVKWLSPEPILTFVLAGLVALSLWWIHQLTRFNAAPNKDFRPTVSADDVTITAYNKDGKLTSHTSGEKFKYDIRSKKTELSGKISINQANLSKQGKSS